MSAETDVTRDSMVRDPVVTILILMARFFSMLQRTLGRGVTHLLTAAQGLGWEPGVPDAVNALEKRQIALAMRSQMRHARKLKRKELKARGRELRKGARA